MPDISSKFAELLAFYHSFTIEFPALKAISVAQWIEESGWGKSELALKHNNFAGMKYRQELSPFAQKVRVKVSDGTHYYCSFASLENFVKAYWINLERSPYKGWRDHTSDPFDFISFIGPIWAQNPKYIDNVTDLLGSAEDLLLKSPSATGSAASSLSTTDPSGHSANHDDTGHGGSRSSDISKPFAEYIPARNVTPKLPDHSQFLD